MLKLLALFKLKWWDTDRIKSLVSWQNSLTEILKGIWLSVKFWFLIFWFILFSLSRYMTLIRSVSTLRPYRISVDFHLLAVELKWVLIAKKKLALKYLFMSPCLFFPPLFYIYIYIKSRSYEPKVLDFSAMKLVCLYIILENRAS